MTPDRIGLALLRSDLVTQEQLDRAIHEQGESQHSLTSCLVRLGMLTEKELADYVSHCAAGRPGEPEEVAEVVVFLAGDQARYMNAQSLFVDGGI